MVAEVVIFAAIGDGFEIFRISTMGDADTGELSLFCHIDCLLFFCNRIIRKLIPGDPAAFFHKTYYPLCVGISLGNLIQGLFCKFLPKVVFVHIHRSFGVVFAAAQRICGFTKWRIM